MRNDFKAWEYRLVLLILFIFAVGTIGYAFLEVAVRIKFLFSEF